MKQHFKRTLAMLLAIVMIFGMLPVSALADGTEATFSLTTNAVEPKIGDTFAVDCNLQSVTPWDAVELQILWNPAVLRFDGFARKLNEDDEPVLDSTALATGMAAVNDEIGRIAWASANLRSKSGKAFTANFTVIGAGPCNLALDKGSVIFSGHDVDITHDFDESAVAGLTVTADEPVHVHSLTAHEPVEPTVETEGSSAYWSCECGKYFADAEGAVEIDENSWVLPRLPEHVHTLTAHEPVEPTEETEGSSAYWSCECGKFFADAEGAVEIEANSWILPVVDNRIATLIRFGYGTGKLYAKNDTEKTRDFLLGAERNGETYSVRLPADDYIFEGYSDDLFLGSIELNVYEGHSDFSDNYGSHGKLLAVTLSHSDATWEYGTDFTFENITVVSGGESMPTPRTVVMGNNSVANRKTVLMHEGDTIMLDLVPQNDKANSYAPTHSFKTCNEGFTFLAITPVTKNTTTVTYPYEDTDGDGENDFILEFGVLRSGSYYVFNYYTPAAQSEPADGKVTATFNTTKSTDYFYKVRNPLNPDAVSYANYSKTTSDAEAIMSVEVTREQMYIGDSSRTKSTVIRDYVTNNQYDSGDLYLASNAPNFLNSDGIHGMIRLDTADNSSCTLYPYRNWLIIEGINNARMIEPDFHVQVINLEGEPITVTENTEDTAGKHSFNIQANSTGTAVLLVTYDAIQAGFAYGNPDFFSAIRPENTGVLVVTVNGTADVNGNMRCLAAEANALINKEPSTSGASGNGARKAGEYMDAELDVLYFLTNEGASYSFTPEAGTEVSIARAVQSGSVAFGTAGVSADENGTFTITGIPEGKSIVRLACGGRVSYQVLRATRTNLTVTDADGNVYYDSATGTLDETRKFAPGEKLTLTYSKLEQPAQKLSGVYNMSAQVIAFGEGFEPVTSKANSGSYNFNTNSAMWTAQATLPATASGEHYQLMGLISLGAYGSLYGDHRMLRYEVGKSPNFTATIKTAYFALPGVELSIVSGIPMTVSMTDENAVPVEGATVTILDGNKFELLPADGVYTVYPGHTYTYTAKADGRESVVSSFTVPAAAESHTLSVELRTIGATTWNGVALTEVVPAADGVYEIRTGAELAWFAAQVNAGTGANWNARLMNDISLNLAQWTPIGLNANAKYNGVFDGCGHVISQLCIQTSTGSDPLGLFGYIGGTAKIMKLGVTGTVSYTGTANTPAGGIAGRMDANARILQCFNAADVCSTKNIGGIAGYTVTGAVITDCYNVGEITVSPTATSAVSLIGGINGGGSSNQTQATMTNCYNAGRVSVVSTTPTTLGPNKAASAVNCFELDNRNTKPTTAPYDTVLTAEELSAAAADIGANFRADTTGLNNGFPVLRWQNTPAPTVEEAVASIAAIGTPITLESKAAIEAARSNYDALSAANAAAVTNYDVLTAAEAKYALFKAAVEAIDALPEAITAANTVKTALNAAQKAVELLAEADQQNLPNLAKYQAALTAWEELMVPVEIATADDLLAFAARVNSASGREIYLNAVLTADIDMQGKTFTTMGSDTSTANYQGTFDGHGFAIKNLVVNDPNLVGGGLFGGIGANGVVRDLTVKDSSFLVRNNCGVIAGTNSGTIYRCVNYADVTQTLTGNFGVAVGIAGTNRGKIEECANFGNMAGDYRIAGISAVNSGTILNCYNAGTMTANNNQAGGIVAYNSGTVTNCYSVGTASVTNTANNTAYPITNAGTVTNCFYLAESETDSVDGTTAKTADELKALAATLGDAFMADATNFNNGYPILKWQNPCEHIDEKNNGTNANGKDGLCDLCGEYCNRAPVLQEGVEAVTENVVAGEAYLLRDLQAGRIFTDPDGDRLSVAGGGAGNAESSTCFYYNRSTDNGETWSEELDFAGALFGATTISLTEREPGTYRYRFYAKDGYGGDSREAGDYWYLTLNVDEPENLNFDIEFYIGKDQNYAANGNRMPIIKLWASDGSSNKVGEEIALTAAEDENGYARVNASVPGGWYVYEGYGWNTETEAYDIPLGGMQIKLPADANVDGAAAGGTDIYLRVMSVYTSSKKADGTYFGAQDYTARVTCPIMQCDAVMGAPYQNGNYTCYPVLFYAGGNSCLFNTYLYPTDTENYMFSQSINGTLPAGTSVQTKSATINSVELLTVTVPADADFSLYFQYNNFNTSEQLPVADWTLNEDGTKTATYKVSKSNGNYSWRMTDTNGVYVTKAGWLTGLTAARSMTLSFDGASTDRNSHSFAALGTVTATRDEADLQVFVSATGAKAVAGTERIRAYRMWQLINSDTANIMIEPDYVWTKLTGPADISFAEDACGELTGTQIDGGNSFHNWADITANGGTSIYAVHYKALDVDLTNATHGGFYPANNPDRTAFVVIADALGSATADVRFNGDFTANSRLPGWDYIYDTWYYLNGEEDPALTFTTNGAECVEYAFGTTNGNMQSSVSSFTEISAADGVYSVPLATLNNAAYNYGGTVIIRMTDASGVYSYQLVKVARMTVTVTNRSFPGEPAMPGNTVVLGFDGLYRSINKISGIFNPTTFYLRYTIDGQEVNGTLGQYQQMDRSSITLTLPTDVTFAEGENTAVVHANNGYVFGSMYSAANPFAAMYYMTDVGVGTNFNAVTVSFAFQKLSDIPITVSKMPTVAVTLNVVNSDSAVLTLTDAAGAVQTAENGVYTLPLGTFQYAVEADGFIKEVGKFNVTMADGDTKTVDITLRAADANTWDGSSAAVTPNADGVYEIRTGSELAWFAAQVNSGAGVNWNAKLMNDISLNWKSWTPIGNSSKKYAGTLDGNGHAITDLYINATDTNQGLFGYVNAATVKNLGVTGSVASTNNNVGGIIGYAAGATVVENCFNAADVTGKQSVGGIVGGSAAATGTINNCYNVGTVIATSKYGGGISGTASSVSMLAKATNCYNVGTVNSAASGGGINPGGAARAVNSYYLDTCYVTGTSAKAGTAKTADELKAAAFVTTLGDAFAADTGINGGYPILTWQASCDHTPGEPMYAPAENGRHTVTVSCTLCGEVISTEEADCTFGDGEVTTAATCTADGVKTYTCSACEGTRTEVIPAAGHVDAGFDGICDVCETVLGTVKTVNVSFTAQALGAFLCAPAEGVEIASNLAERYGYADGISYLSGVSALDVLVAANIAVVGEEDFASAPQEFLTAGASDYGFSVTRLFGVLTANNGFAINRGYANDGTPSTYGGYNGYTVNNAPVADGDLVEFFLYQDSYATDNYTYLTVAEEAVAGTAFTVNVKGISFGWRGYEFATAEAMKAAATPIEGVSLAIVDKTTGALTDLEVETDKDGNVSVTIAQPGTVVLVAYGEDDTETPVIMTMTEITVAEPAGVPGDVNGDGVMDLTDVTLIKRSLLPETHNLYKPLTADQLRLADVNGDGVVDLTDVTLIKRSLLPETHNLYRTLG